MGVDLILLPLDPYSSNESEPSSLNILEVGRSRKLWESIRKLPSHPLTAPLRTPLGMVEGDDMEAQEIWDLRRMFKDTYDEPLCWVAASDLLSLRSHEGVDSYFESRAAWAYLAELPPETRIVLYWY